MATEFDRIWTDAAGYERHGKDKYVHRTIAEKAIGRPLKGAELVHHVDENKANNSENNLVICPDQQYHQLLHARQRVVDLGGNPDKDKYCSYHKTLHDKKEFSYSYTQYDGLHNNCRKATNEYRKEKGLNADKFDWKARLMQQYRRCKKNHKDVSWLNERS